MTTLQPKLPQQQNIRLDFQQEQSPVAEALRDLRALKALKPEERRAEITTKQHLIPAGKTVDDVLKAIEQPGFEQNFIDQHLALQDAQRTNPNVNLETVVRDMHRTQAPKAAEERPNVIGFIKPESPQRDLGRSISQARAA